MKKKLHVIDELDWFMYNAVVQENKELRQEIECLINILERNHLEIPEKIKSRMKKENMLPFN